MYFHILKIPYKFLALISKIITIAGVSADFGSNNDNDYRKFLLKASQWRKTAIELFWPYHHS